MRLVGGLRLGRFGKRQASELLPRARAASLTYEDVGSTLDPTRWDAARVYTARVVVGGGRAAFLAARRALKTWVPQRALGAEIWPDDASVTVDQTVLVVLRRGPIYMVAPDRVVAVVDEPDRFAFAYGTPRGHPERGEESFTVEELADGTVRATVRVDAGPATRVGRAAAPLVRGIQRAALRRYLRAIADVAAGASPTAGDVFRCPPGSTGGSMSDNQPFRVEVTVQASQSDVWRALTEPAQVRRWHGWDAPDLDAEIRYIYVDHAHHIPPERIQLGDEADRHWIELDTDGARTVVRAVRAGPEGQAERHQGYDVIAEGWRSFFEQLRHYLERHPGEERRTIFLEGWAVASALSAALDHKLPSEPWYEDRFQRGIATDRYGDGLVVLATREPLDSDLPGPVHVTVTTHGLDDAEFAVAREEWWSWWSPQVDVPKATVH